MKLHTDLKSSNSPKMRQTLMPILALSLICLSNTSAAREVHSAHTHGTADLSLAFEAGDLEVLLQAPANSFLGFEHRPSTQKEIDAVDGTRSSLKAPLNVLSFSGATCELNYVDVDIVGPAGEPSVDEEHHDEDIMTKNIMTKNIMTILASKHTAR